MEKNFEIFSKKYLDLKRGQKDFVSIQIVKTLGSSPQETGARMIVCDGKVAYGTVGGGKLEAFAIKEASFLLLEKSKIRAKLISLNLQKDLKMTCGGEVSLFLEAVKEAFLFKVLIFGAGHISQELNIILNRIDCQLICVDQRKEWLNKLDGLKTKQIHLGEMENYADLCDQKSFVVLMTMGHSTDGPILERLLKRGGFPYIGVIGSDGKSHKLKEAMRKVGVLEELVESFYCPIGLKIGNHSPTEIALSIAAGLIEKRDQYFEQFKKV